MNTRIIIADDHPIFRAGIREVIAAIPGCELAGEASNGLDAYQLVIRVIPDIAILDLDMPLLNGLDVCRKVLSEKHFTKFIILTMHKDRHYFDDAMACGVMGYLLKDYAADELVKCIAAVTTGRKYASALMESLLTEHNTRENFPDEVRGMLATLTPTEKVIVKLIAQSKTSQEIADSMFISPNTVDNHRSNIARKLKLEGKNSLLKFAMQYRELF
jgi:DNA-binding NarL/FixJ family response regulator